MNDENLRYRILETLNDENLRRFLYLPYIIIPINIFLIIFFLKNLPDSSDIEYTWRIGIIYTHITIAIVVFISFIFAYYQRKKKFLSNKMEWYILYIMMFIAMVLGITLTIFDQYVTESIHPLIIVSIFVALIVNVPPVSSITVFLLSYLIYFLLLPITQTDQNILLSNSVNGFAIIGLSILISNILWRSNYSRAKQAITIEYQQKELEIKNSELLTQSIQLKELNSTKDKFFSIIAHDLRSPLSGFMSITRIMAEEFEDLTQNEIFELSQNLKESSENIFNLLENLLQWAKIQGSLITYNPENFNLHNVVKTNIDITQVFAKDKQIEVNNKIDVDLSIFADLQMINTIIRNLLTNSLKFTPRGGQVEIGTLSDLNNLVNKEDNSIDISLRESIVVYVRDNGIGMDNDLKKNIFDIEKKVSRPGTEGELSTGLGLVLCKEFVGMNGGKLWVESEVDKGSTFFFTIPMNKLLISNKINQSEKKVNEINKLN